MTISTYAELQTAIADHAHRDDVAAKATEFIQLAEDRLRTAFQIEPVMEAETETTLTANARDIDLPAGWIASRDAYIDGDVKTHLEIVPLSYMNSVWGGSESGKPDMMTIVNGKIRLAPTPDGSYDLVLRYYSLPALSVSNTTNWLLTSHPKLYLSACLSEVYGWTQNDREQQKHESIVSNLIQMVVDGDTNARWSQSPLEIRAS